MLTSFSKAKCQAKRRKLSAYSKCSIINGYEVGCDVVLWNGDQRPKNERRETKRQYYDDRTKAQLGEASLDYSYWLLMTRDVLEGSRAKAYPARRVVGYLAGTQSTAYAYALILSALFTAFLPWLEGMLSEMGLSKNA